MKILNDTALGSYALETSVWLIWYQFCGISFHSLKMPLL